MNASSDLMPFELWPTSWPYWTRMYSETAKRLHESGDYQAADDIATLVMGLVEYELRTEAFGEEVMRHVTGLTEPGEVLRGNERQTPASPRGSGQAVDHPGSVSPDVKANFK